MEALGRLKARVLEVDGATGRLYYRDDRDQDRIEVRNEAEARALARRDAEGPDGPRPVYYTLLIPANAAADVPSRPQEEAYEEWFKDVPHVWVNLSVQGR
jgi:hypothetical protein